MIEMRCPLCSGEAFGAGWFDVAFLEKVFEFPECNNCRSLICHPMPDHQTLARMYDASYLETGEDTGDDFSITKSDEVRAFLRSIEPKRFIDYGCGSGKLLLEAREMGWDVLGIDFNPDFASDLKELGITVIGNRDAAGEKADVVHLGDVLEHLTEMDEQFPQILDLVKDDGYLIATGPLEGNANLFFWLLKLGKKIRGNRTTEMPPFHVILATTKGQRKLFERSDLIEIEFRTSEVAWPAPATLPLRKIANIKWTGLFFARKLSQLTSRSNMKRLGNRYFYIGKKPIS